MAVTRAAVLGSPIAHSLSPVLHRAAYAELGLDWSYDAIEVTESTLATFIESCGPAWRGLSLTMPLKTVVLPLLSRASDLVDAVGAANTVIFGEGGPEGHNTDVNGMCRAIAEAAGDAFAPRTATILGGGATARSAVAAVGQLGVLDVHLCLRTMTRAEEFADLADRLGVNLHPHGWVEASHHLDGDIVIATTPAGTADALAGAVPARPGVLLDVAYGAGRSRLVEEWSTRGAPVADGLALLLWQASDQVTLFTGEPAPIEAMRAALREAAGH
ncbi:MAG: shikimate dehydrogenase [Actinomycetota bacterium]